MSKLSYWFNRFRYRIGIKYLLFFLIYVVFLTAIVLVVVQYIDSKEAIFAMPAVIIGYDRLFSIIRKGFNYGVSQLDKRKDSDRMLNTSSQFVKFAKLVFVTFYFWQTDWSKMLKQNTYWANWMQMQSCLQAILNRDFNLVETKYLAKRDFKTFYTQMANSYYFKNLDQDYAQIQMFHKKKDYPSLKITFAKMENDSIIIKKIFQLLFLWLNSIKNDWRKNGDRDKLADKTGLTFINVAGKNLVTNSFLEIALETINKKMQPLALITGA